MRARFINGVGIKNVKSLGLRKQKEWGKLSIKWTKQMLLEDSKFNFKESAKCRQRPAIIICTYWTKNSSIAVIKANLLKCSKPHYSLSTKFLIVTNKSNFCLHSLNHLKKCFKSNRKQNNFQKSLILQLKRE